MGLFWGGGRMKEDKWIFSLFQLTFEDLLYQNGVDLAVWAHVHNYERTLPVYKSTVKNGSAAHPYTDPRATVHIVNGAGVRIPSLDDFIIICIIHAKCSSSYHTGLHWKSGQLCEFSHSKVECSAPTQIWLRYYWSRQFHSSHLSAKGWKGTEWSMNAQWIWFFLLLFRTKLSTRWRSFRIIMDLLAIRDSSFCLLFVCTPINANKCYWKGQWKGLLYMLLGSQFYCRASFDIWFEAGERATTSILAIWRTSGCLAARLMTVLFCQSVCTCCCCCCFLWFCVLWVNWSVFPDEKTRVEQKLCLRLLCQYFGWQSYIIMDPLLVHHPFWGFGIWQQILPCCLLSAALLAMASVTVWYQRSRRPAPQPEISEEVSNRLLRDAKLTLIPTLFQEKDQLIEDWTPEPLTPPLDPYHHALRPRQVTSIYGKRITVDKVACLNFATHNYLGFVEDQECLNAATSALETYGVGSCGPRGFFGTVDVHLQLEEKIAAFMGTEEAILYSFGFSAISSSIPAYAKVGDVIYA